VHKCSESAEKGDFRYSIAVYVDHPKNERSKLKGRSDMAAKDEIPLPEAMDAAELEGDLMRLYGGPVVGGPKLASALGFRSNIVFQRAVRRRAIPLPFFRMEGRRGVFVLVKDLARYLLQRRALGHQLPRSTTGTGQAEGRAQRS